MRQRRHSLLLSILFAFAACDEGPKSTELPAIEIISQGSDQFTPLALQLTKGHTETLSAEVELTAVGAVNGKASPTSTIALSFAVTAKVTEVTDRWVRADLEVSKHEVGAAGDSALSKSAHELLGKALSRMPKITGELVISPTGFITKLELSTEKGLSNQQRQVQEALRSAIAQLAIPRPGKATAPTQWKSTVNASRNGFALAQELELGLEKSGAVRLSLVETLDPDKTSASPPGVYADSVEVTAYTGRGSGELRLDPGQIFPTTARIELGARSALSVEQAGKTDVIESEATLKLHAKSE